MKIVEKIPYLIIAGFVYLLIYSSCANTGMPSGGPRDSLPPVLLRTQPAYAKLNFKGEELRFTFDEYIVTDKVNELLVISPPLEQRPLIRTKSKTLVIEFNEELRDSITYSVDFKDAIEDNNEQNPIKNLRFAFSTWDVFDTLRVAGMVKKASTIEPVEKTLIMLHSNMHDSAVYTLPPDYIAKTNEKGIFMISNIAPGKYNIFSINDANSNMRYDEGGEEIAFYDSVIVPSVYFEEKPDTIATGADSLLISGHYHFLPEPVYLRQFTEDIFSQYMSASERISRYNCKFIFEETVKDTFAVNLLNHESESWSLLEPNPTYDTIGMWITDTIVANFDTIDVELNYRQLDSAGMPYIQHDTLALVFYDKKKEPVKKKRRDKDKEKEEKIIIPQFSFSSNIKSTDFDLNKPIYLTAPQPVKQFNLEQVYLYELQDTNWVPQNFKIEKDTNAWRSYRIDYKWLPDTDYRFNIDSAACEDIYGVTNKELKKKFNTQEDDYYGVILLTTSNVKGKIILQLLDVNEEKIYQEKIIEKDGVAKFEYLYPEKYIIKAIYDRNGNNKWDPGNFSSKVQPEEVAYFQKVIKIKSNWDHKESWDLSIDPTFPKNIYDQEAEEKKREEAEKKRKQENNKQGQGSNSSSFGNLKL